MTLSKASLGSKQLFNSTLILNWTHFWLWKKIDAVSITVITVHVPHSLLMFQGQENKGISSEGEHKTPEDLGTTDFQSFVHMHIWNLLYITMLASAVLTKMPKFGSPNWYFAHIYVPFPDPCHMDMFLCFFDCRTCKGLGVWWRVLGMSLLKCLILHSASYLALFSGF